MSSIVEPGVPSLEGRAQGTAAEHPGVAPGDIAVGVVIVAIIIVIVAVA